MRNEATTRFDRSSRRSPARDFSDSNFSRDASAEFSSRKLCANPEALFRDCVDHDRKEPRATRRDLRVIAWRINVSSMKTKSFLLVLTTISAGFGLALFSGCASKPTVSSHADNTVAYAHYKTFAVMQPSQASLSHNRAATPTLVRQARVETETAFANKGLAKSSGTSAELIIVVHGGMDEKVDLSDAGLSSARFNRGFAARGLYTADAHKEGSLFIDVFDARTKELVWRGSASIEINDTPKPDDVKAAVAAIVARYPN